MDKEKLMCAFFYVCGFVAVLAVCWLMLGDGDKPPGHIDNIRQGLGSIESEQRRAEESLGRIEAGIDRSEEGAGRLADSIDRSESIIGAIADDIDRGTGEVDRALGRIEIAESGNREAAAGIDRASAGISDGLRRADESESIFTRYESGNRGERGSMEETGKPA